jgi:tripartite-type tricarboxylate transporter receptor subunit TctC
MVHVPYRGLPQSSVDLIGGRIDFMIDGASINLVESGRLRALAVTSRERLPGFESVPTAAETVAGFESIGWFGIFAPKGLPAAVIEQINQDLNKVLQQPALIARFAELGVYPKAGSIKAFDEFLQSQRNAWKKVVQDLGLQPQ